MQRERITLLLVEDNPGDARLLREMLAETAVVELDVHQVSRLDDAIELLTSAHHDVVLLDLSLPDSEGLETLVRLQAQTPDVPVVVLTGLHDETLAIRAVQKGAEDYLVKGHVDGNVLLRSIRYAIERKRAGIQRAQLIREQIARAEAETALRVRDEFLALASHDLKNPLTTIKGLSQLLKRYASHLSPSDEVKRIVDGLTTIDATTTRMLSLMNELLDVAHMQMGRPLLLDRREIDLVALSRQVTAEYDQSGERHRITVESSVPELLGNWDAPRLERVLGNLLSNAMKYSPEGGDVVVQIEQEMDWAVLSVRDRGIGIPAGDLPRIFDRFHRAANVIGRVEGTGIGLASARHIAEQHGGTITVESEVGSGSSFTVRLPLSDGNR
jgi:signal transduction histidine kinase